jgi:hypothetical protein
MAGAERMVSPAAADLAAMAIMVAAARTLDKATGAGTGGIEVRRADMVMAIAARAVAAMVVLVAALSRIVDSVVGGKADPLAGSANGVPADRETSAAAVSAAAVASMARAAQGSAGSVVGGR